MKETRSKDIEKRLLKVMTIKMEEWGMPKYSDNYPAMDILQVIKDAGYSL